MQDEKFLFECYLVKLEGGDGHYHPVIDMPMDCGRRIEMYCESDSEYASPIHFHQGRFDWCNGQYVDGTIEHDGEDYYFKSDDGKHDFHGDLSKRFFRISRGVKV